jgi:hypothetical protein
MPVLIGTVEGAIEAILGLPNRVQERPHWRTAKEALYKAVESSVATEIENARQELEAALAEEQWLY